LRFSLSTGSLYLYPLRHTFALAKELGFEGLEVALSLEVLVRRAGYVRRLSLEYGLPVFSLHPPMIPWPKLREHHKLLPQLTSVARDLGCHFIVIHAPKALTLTEGVGAEYAGAVRACVEDLRGSSLRLCVENQAVFRPSDRRYVLSAPGGLRQFAEEYDLSVTLDTAHAASFPYDLIEAYETWESRLVNIHLSDFRQNLSIPPWFNLHSYFKHHQVPGDADLPLVPLLERLKADSYEGLITVEVSPFALEAWRPQRVRENLKRCLDFVQRPCSPFGSVEDRKRARMA
jgi:sugar phosphate isomerase/epimerase